VDSGLFWRALVVQALAIAVLSGVLIALPLSDDFFDDFGIVVGPLAWILCSIVTARVLSLPLSVALFAAAAGGVAGGLVTLAASHWPGIGAGLLVFAAACGSYAAEPDEPGGALGPETG
jgi:hypothetical protein